MMISKDFYGNGNWDYPWASYILELDSLVPLAEFTIDGNIFRCYSDEAVPLNTFSHVAATYDGTNVKIYVNGVLKNTCYKPGTLTYGDMTDLALGSRSPYTPGEGVTGLLDEASIYNHALSATEIQAIFLADSKGKCKVVPVVIDIKPGSFPNSINPRSGGKIPVAILTTGTFDANTVDPTTVLFGRTGTEAVSVHAALEDVNGDGKLDLVLHFNTQTTGIQCGDTSASLTGKTTSGTAIEGSDSIRTVGCK